jgi:hypothetical protein
MVKWWIMGSELIKMRTTEGQEILLHGGEN